MDPEELLNGVKEFTTDELEELFNGEDKQATPPVTEETTPPETQPVDGKTTEVKPKEIEATKAFAKRLSEETAKIREQTAKEAGFTSYAEMIKEKEAKIIKDKGLNPEDVTSVVDELVKTRLDQDPRMKELEDLRKQKLQDFAKKELAEITKLTNGEITKLEQLPKEVIEIWKTTGSLKSAFLSIKGEELILKATSAASKGTTDHLANPGGTTPPVVKTRPLTDEEKIAYKYFNPKITDEELNKKTYNID